MNEKQRKEFDDAVTIAGIIRIHNHNNGRVTYTRTSDVSIAQLEKLWQAALASESVMGLVEAVRVAATAEVIDLSTGLIDYDVLRIVQETAQAAIKTLSKEPYVK